MAQRIRMTAWLAGSALLFVASSASAQEGMLFKNLMEGVMGGGGNDIEYRQRPPLVVPPGSALPRPQEPSRARNAAWPNDPDVARRRAEAADARTPATERRSYKQNERAELTPEERRLGYRPGPSSLPLTPPSSYDEVIGPIRIGRELAERKYAESSANLIYGSEPERRHLYEPPVGYRRPAGSAPLGPGRSGPRRDTQAVGEREFAAGQPHPTVTD